MKKTERFSSIIMALFLIVFPCILTGCKGGTREEARTMNVIGTVCTVNAFEDGTRELYDSIQNCLVKIENDFSVNIDSSEISGINRNAGIKAVKVSSDVLEVIKASLYYASISDGAFDPTIGPLVSLWNISSDNPYVPSEEEINALLPLVDYKKVIIDEKESSVYLEEKGMSIDLGGIAKGYAADCIAGILEENKVKRAVIDLGGNIYVYGTKKDGSMWNVGIKNPFYDRGEPALAVKVDGNSSIVTSGVYERYFIQDGKFYHHIMDTSTGCPFETDILSSTIICSSSMKADALSTIAFIKGYEAFKDIALKEGVDWIYIDENKKVFASSSLKENLTSYDSNYKDISFID